MSDIFDPEFSRDVSRAPAPAVHDINAARKAITTITENALQRRRMLTDEESRKNVPFEYRGIGITNADSDLIAGISFTTHVDSRPLGVTTLRVDFRRLPPKVFDGASREVPSQTFHDIPIAICEQMLADPSLYHKLIEHGFVEGEPERYKGFDIFWTGWKPTKNGTELVGQWIALTGDGKRRAYSSVPGGDGFYELGERFDTDLRVGQRPVRPDMADAEAMMAEARDRLIALLIRNTKPEA